MYFLASPSEASYKARTASTSGDFFNVLKYSAKSFIFLLNSFGIHFPSGQQGLEENDEPDYHQFDFP